MSNNTVTNTVVVADKKITLAGKYTKFLVCGYWSIDRLLATGIIDEATAHTARVELCLFAGPEKQNEMFDLFFAGLKDSTKSMKALVKEHNKPPPKAKKEKVIKEKKPKGSKKLTVCDPQDELVAEIVAAAQTEISPGAEKRTVVRSGSCRPLETPRQEESLGVVETPVADQGAAAVVVTETVEPVKKKVVKKGAPAVPPNPLPLTAVDDAEATKAQGTAAPMKPPAAEDAAAKKATKVAEDEAKKAAKALEAETKKAAKAAEDEAKKLSKAAEDEAKKIAKALEAETKKAAKAAEDEAKKAAKAAEVEAKKAAKAQAKPTKKEKETKAPVDQPSDDEEEINVGSHEEDDDQDTLNLRPISFPDGRNFLLDESNNSLYDPSCVDLDDFAPVATYRGNQWFPLTPSLAGLEA